jgi:hypothetical protein
MADRKVTLHDTLNDLIEAARADSEEIKRKIEDSSSLTDEARVELIGRAQAMIDSLDEYIRLNPSHEPSRMAKGVRWNEADLREFVKRGQGAQRAGTQLARAHGKTTAQNTVDFAMDVHVTRPRKESKLEIRFGQQLAVDGLPPAIRNYLFLPDRDLELDFAWPQWKLSVEIQGSAHRASMAMLDRDCEKICLALLAGWWVLPLGNELVRSGRGLELLLAAVKVRSKGRPFKTINEGKP